MGGWQESAGTGGWNTLDRGNSVVVWYMSVCRDGLTPETVPAGGAPQMAGFSRADLSIFKVQI